jgi:hypothetical protein
MAEKPGSKPAGKAPPADSTDHEPGQLGQDDRGNVTWNWNSEGDLLADDAVGQVERVRALVDPGMEVTDEEEPSERNPIAKGSKRLRTGYNPYNSGALGKQSWKKKKDLRELSKWIELRKKMDQKKGEE